ncbi:hypothetical protein SLE2022_353890 [Rubroshorea leprosula]
MARSFTTTSPTNGSSASYSVRAGALDCLKILLFIFFLILLISIVPCATFAVIRLQPTLPVFTLESSLLSFTNTSISKVNTITANWNLTFTVENPNNHRIVYDQITASAFHEKECLANAAIAAFELPGKNKTTFLTGFSVMRWRWGSRNCSRVNNETQCEGLKVVLRAKASFEGWTWPTRRDNMTAECTAAFDSGWECNVSGKWKDIKGMSLKVFWGYIFFAGVALCLLLISF